jgi:F0F1-type ATP synthase membrane subunit b/b'
MTLPQFDISFFGSQIFWCLSSFLILWASLHFVVVPRFFQIRQCRQDLVEEMLKKAYGLEGQTASLLSQSKLSVDLAHKEARILILDAKTTCQKEYALFCQKLEKEYEQKFYQFQSDLLVQEKEILRSAFQEKEKYVQAFMSQFVLLDSGVEKKNA